jgi:hypothetical protein
MPTNEPSSSSNPESVNRCAAEAGAKDAAKKMSEAEYLRKQADDAKAAIGAALSDARAAMAEGIDPREWTRRYPLVAVGSALAAGFVAAVLAVPSREQQELKKLEKIRRALHPEPAASDGKEGKKTKVEVETPESSWWSTLLREAMSLIRPVLLSALTAGLTGRMGGEQSSGRAQAAAGAAVGVADDAATEARRHQT